MTISYKTPGYMQAFRCLGGECEDTCCQHWDIHFDRRHYELLREAVAGLPDEEQRFASYVRVNPAESASQRSYACIELNEQGFCPFLEENGLCHLHSKFGISPLSNICAFFPRVLSAYAEQIEMTGAMSCPEVARLCLLSETKAQDFVEFDPRLLPRNEDLPLARQVPASGIDFYADQFMQVRESLLWLARLDSYAFETRLYFLSNFAHRLAQGYHQQSDENIKRLQEEIRRIQDNKTLDSLDNYFLNYTSSEPVAMIVIQAILQLRLQQAPADKLGLMVQSILDAYRAQLVADSDIEVYGNNLPPMELWQSYQQQWDRVNAQYGIRLEQHLTRYLVNCLQREWFISMPDPFVYIHLLCIRLAILRFLIASHPRLQTCLDERAQDAVLDALIVEIVYLFARGIDHNHAFLHVIYQALAEQQMMSFDYALPLIKF